MSWYKWYKGTKAVGIEKISSSSQYDGLSLDWWTVQARRVSDQAMVPKIRKRALGVLAITKHSNNWPKGLQVRDYEMVAMAVAVVCNKNACSGLIEYADFSDVYLTGSDSETGICLSLIQEQPEALQRVATLCVYANMLGCGHIARKLLKRVLSVTNEVREKLYIACKTPTRAWRVKEGLSQ